MKDFIASYLMDIVDDNYGETGLTESQIDEATEYIWQVIKIDSIYDEIDRLLAAYLSRK